MVSVNAIVGHSNKIYVATKNLLVLQEMIFLLQRETLLTTCFLDIVLLIFPKMTPFYCCNHNTEFINQSNSLHNCDI